MPMSLNANKSAMDGPRDVAGEKSDALQDAPRTRLREEVAVYALTPRTEVSSLAILKSSLDQAASRARMALSAGEQIAEVLNQMRESAEPSRAGALMARIDQIAGSAAFDSDENPFGPAPRDFAAAGPVLNLGAAATPALESAIGRVGLVLAEMDAEAGQIEKHVALVAKLQDLLVARVGDLVQADMDQEGARLQALQVQQQLGAHALSLANSQPQALLELFRGE